VVTYADAPVSIHALVDVLCGQVSPMGKLPVALPGLSPRGAGRTPLREA
jgi:hypothetical protein